MTGMYDFGIRAAKGSKDSPSVIVTVLACVDIPDDPTVLRRPPARQNSRTARTAAARLPTATGWAG